MPVRTMQDCHAAGDHERHPRTNCPECAHHFPKERIPRRVKRELDHPNLFDITNQPSPIPFQVKSPTSTEAAREIKPATQKRRRDQVLAIVKLHGPIARFEIAERMGVPDHWITSYVLQLVEMTEIEELPGRTKINPLSDKRCALLAAIEH